MCWWPHGLWWSCGMSYIVALLWSVLGFTALGTDGPNCRQQDVYTVVTCKAACAWSYLWYWFQSVPMVLVSVVLWQFHHPLRKHSHNQSWLFFYYRIDSGSHHSWLVCILSFLLSWQRWSVAAIMYIPPPKSYIWLIVHVFILKKSHLIRVTYLPNNCPYNRKVHFGEKVHVATLWWCIKGYLWAASIRVFYEWETHT